MGLAGICIGDAGADALVTSPGGCRNEGGRGGKGGDERQDKGHLRIMGKRDVMVLPSEMCVSTSYGD